MVRGGDDQDFFLPMRRCKQGPSYSPPLCLCSVTEKVSKGGRGAVEGTYRIPVVLAMITGS